MYTAGQGQLKFPARPTIYRVIANRASVLICPVNAREKSVIVGKAQKPCELHLHKINIYTPKSFFVYSSIKRHIKYRENKSL